MKIAEGSCLEKPWQVEKQYGSTLTKKEAAKAFVVPFSLRFTGIQKNVQALYYILKHPLVYRDAKPQLDSMQKPYVTRKKVKSRSSEGRLVASVSGSTHVFGWMLRA